jgi:uncharacterized protein YndB with AHSA1/START domain
MSNELEMSRVFDAPRARLWKAWTDPEELMKWWGPSGFSSPVAIMDLRKNGRYLFGMSGPDAEGRPVDMYEAGEFKEVIPMDKIVSIGHFSDAEGRRVQPSEYGLPGEWPEYLTQTVVFSDMEGGRTLVEVRQNGIPEEMAGLTRTGWEESFDKLAKILE